MKKRRNLPVWSFGGEEPDPNLSVLAAWAGRQKGASCDLLSFKVEHSLQDQIGLDRLAYGGMFYADRMRESIGGIRSGFLREEPWTSPDSLRDDAARASAISRNVWAVLPSPLHLKIDDGIYSDREEYESALCRMYGLLMREIRDAGVYGTIIIGEQFSALEREMLPGRRVRLHSLSGTSRALSGILEVQNSLSLSAKRLIILPDLLDEYEIRSVSVIDGTEKDFAGLLSYFDPGDITAGGFSLAGGKKYWDGVHEHAFVFV
ncbi:hypothetical protein [Methanogenium organophilum]|uniref:Uncharacterized protein n=1 Tax=Methanogenium organophilum TaxID=2199 RepID=A0A9X9S2M9_METOG|nr:hypothetical protein [Methanogenium organophilum]WAI00754.1 hypothetical protein OU421_10025 [Methanogenium organophilum]